MAQKLNAAAVGAARPLREERLQVARDEHQHTEPSSRPAAPLRPPCPAHLRANGAVRKQAAVLHAAGLHLQLGRVAVGRHQRPAHKGMQEVVSVIILPDVASKAGMAHADVGQQQRLLVGAVSRTSAAAPPPPPKLSTPDAVCAARPLGRQLGQSGQRILAAHSCAGASMLQGRGSRRARDTVEHDVRRGLHATKSPLPYIPSCSGCSDRRLARESKGPSVSKGPVSPSAPSAPPARPLTCATASSSPTTSASLALTGASPSSSLPPSAPTSSSPYSPGGSGGVSILYKRWC